MEVDWTTNLGRYSGGKSLEERIEQAKKNFNRSTQEQVLVYDVDGNFLGSGPVSVIAEKLKTSRESIIKHVNIGRPYRGKFYLDYDIRG